MDWSYRNERSRYRFMGAFIPLFVLAFIALWNPPEMGYMATILWFVIFLLAVHIADGAIIISYYALGAEISTNYNDRTRVTSLRESVRIVGLLVAAALPSVIGGVYGVPFAFSCFSLLFGVCLVGFFILAYTKGPTGQLPPQRNTQSKRQYLETFKNRKFLWIVAIHSLNVFAFAIPTALFAFFVRDRVGAPHLEGAFLVLYFLSGVAGMALWSHVAQRTSKKQSWLYALLLGAVTLFMAFFVKSGDVDFFFSICFFSGLTFGADLALPPSLLADVIDERPDQDQVSTASYFGVWNLTAKISTALAPGLAFPLLDFTGYGQSSEVSSSLGTLALIYGVVPCCLKLSTAFLLLISPLDREKDQIPWPLKAKTV